MAVLFCLIWMFISKVDAKMALGQAVSFQEYIPNIYLKKVEVNGNIRYRKARFIRKNDDGGFVYCLQPFVDIDNRYPYVVVDSDYEHYLSMTTEQWERIRLLAYYGYGYENHTDPKWYAVTQVLIWRTAEPMSAIYFTDTLGGGQNENLFASEIAELENLVAHHSQLPDFLEESLAIPLGEEVILNDIHLVLNNFSIYEQKHVSAVIKGNALYLTANEVGDASIDFIKEDQLYSGPPIVYFSEESQNVLSVGSYVPVHYQLHFKVIGGYVELTKRDSETGENVGQGLASLASAKYDEDDVLITTIITDENGFSKSEYLPKFGQYYLQEIEPSLGYLLDPNRYPFIIGRENPVAFIEVFEEVIKQKFEFTKVYASALTQIIQPEVGVQFGVYDHSGNLIYISTTDENGKLLLELPYGKYILHQFTSTSGYEKMDDYFFEVEEAGPTVYKIFSDAEIQARIRVTKVDQDGKRLFREGIRFKIKNIVTNEYVCQTVSYPNFTTYCEYVTDENGVFIIPYALPFGNYQLEELDQTIEGYVWNSTPFSFVIDENSILNYEDNLGAVMDISFVNQEVLGMIEIYKFGEQFELRDFSYFYQNVPLSGVIFGLYDEWGQLIQKIITDSNGYAKVEGLKLGRYTLQELASVSGYIIDNQKYEFELCYQDSNTPIIKSSFTFYNLLRKGTLEFTKVDAYTNASLPNTVIEVYDEFDTFVSRNVTDENGKVLFYLPFGRYYIVEREAPMGYQLNFDKLWFEFSNQEFLSLTMKDEIVEVPDTLQNKSIWLDIVFVICLLYGLFAFLYRKVYHEI